MIARRWNDEPDGERDKAAAHALLEARRKVYVNRGRRELLNVLLCGDTATADDVRDAVRLPDGMNPVCMGAVPGLLARAGIIRRAGFVKTNRAAARARPVTVWQLADRAAAMQWLTDHPDMPDPADDAGPASTLFD